MALPPPRVVGAVLASVSLLARASGDWEWSAVFDLQPGHYTWSFSKKSVCSYADPAIRFVSTPVAYASTITEDEERAAEALWDGAITTKTAYQELEVGQAYSLNFDSQVWTTHFIIHVDTAGPVAFFLEHMPYEFEESFHFLQDASGNDVEPTYEPEVSHDGHDHGRRLSSDGHEGHDHGEEEEESETVCPWTHEWEWSAIFPVYCCSGPCYYDWNMQKAGGDYADAHMKIVLLAIEDGHTSFDEPMLQQAHNAYDAITDEKNAGETLDTNMGYELHLNPATWATHFKIRVPQGTSHLAVFAQHFPTEFEDHYHYLKGAAGQDIEPLKESSVSDCKTEEYVKENRWGEVIASSFITVLPTLLSIAFVVKLFMPKLEAIANGESLALAVIMSFASGVIFAAAVFLLLPEGLLLVGVGKTEAGTAGAWGTAILGGWLFAVIVKHSLSIIFNESTADAARTVENGDVEVQQGQDAKTATRWNVCVPVLLGDMFHNISDGFVIGVAFNICSATFAWKLTAITVLHELPQEVSDFAILVSRGRMHWIKATGLNFLSGLSTVLGAIITYSADVSQGAQGVILAAGAGMYLYVAMTELGPAVSELTKAAGPGWSGSSARIAAFAIGAVIIGLVLLDHEHCVPEDPNAADPHAGHNHGGEEDAHAGHNH